MFKTLKKGFTASLLFCFLAGQVLAQTVALQSLEKLFVPDKTTVYVAKKIITMDEARPAATAVAVTGDRIAAVGTLAEVKEALKGQSFTIDKRFAGQVITPGLIDPHLHLWLFALVAPMVFITPDDWDLPWAKIKGISGRDAYLQKLSAAEKSLKNKKEWFFSWGYHQYFHGQLSRRDLDQISATRPIMIWHRSCHEMYFNTAALNAMKITEAMLKGHGHASEQVDFANGHFWEAGLSLIVKPLYPHLASPLRFVKGLEKCKEYVGASGMTTTADPGIMLPNLALDMMKLVFDNDRTSFRNLLIPSGQTIYEKYGAANALAETEKIIEKRGHRVYYLPKQIKFYCDGAAFSQGMQMKDGYTDGHKGAWIQTPEELAACSKLYWDAGYQIRIHVNGDLGSEVTIGILDKLMKESPRRDHRFSIEHYCVSTPDQAAQMAKLGGLISANPYYIYVLADKYSEVGLGPERAQTMVRCNSVLKNNIPLSLHSDTPMAPASPLTLAWAAVNRLTMSGKVAGPEEKISAKEALKTITINAAYVLQQEKEIGSIVPGKLADLTVLEDDPLAVAPEKLKEIAVWGNIFEGKIYQNKFEHKVTLSAVTDLARLESDPAGLKMADIHEGCACYANQLLQGIAREMTPSLF
ncbi:MAG: amidohydrolase [Candidatus Margulisbacteria bacterium]|nr:amidohydrolase [Candidatus Margulisiibacteriota bacterium]